MSTPRIIYFSSITENTKHFIDRLPFESERLPLLTKELTLDAKDYFVLATPTYGGGRDEALIPKQVLKFLSVKENREFCVGIIGGGNRLFGAHYASASDMLSSRLGVPVLARFEIRGMLSDVEHVTSGLNANWSELVRLRREFFQPAAL